MQVQTTFPSESEALELVEVGNGLFDHPPDGAKTDDLLATPLREMIGSIRLGRSQSRKAAES